MAHPTHLFPCLRPLCGCLSLQVNGDFGSIFSTLLPGTTAKLDPMEGCSFMEGGWDWALGGRGEGTVGFANARLVPVAGQPTSWDTRLATSAPVCSLQSLRPLCTGHPSLSNCCTGSATHPSTARPAPLALSLSQMRQPGMPACTQNLLDAGGPDPAPLPACLPLQAWR